MRRKLNIAGWVVEPGGTVILLTLLSASVLGENNTIPASATQVKTVLKRCSDFHDTRNVTNEDIFLTIPANLTNSNETVDFRIDKENSQPSCKTYFLKTVKWEQGEDMIPFKSSIRGERLRNSGKSSSHFTHDGHFHYDSHYYSSKDFCMQSISETEIQLRICNVSCEDSSWTCIPKCCGADEILIYWNFTCRKVTQHEKKWKARLHDPVYPHMEILDESELEKIHFYRQKLACQAFEPWPLTETVRPKKKVDPNPAFAWKLLPNKRPVFVRHDRRWTHIPEGKYCVDGFANWGFGGDGTYSGKDEEHSVLLICPDNSTATFVAEFYEWKAWLYFGVLVVSSLFLLLTVVIHVMLLDKQHLHGLTVLCHSISMFFMYIFCAIAHIVSIYPEWKGMEPRSGFCLSVAILSHYFFMTSFTWLSIMNFDLWLTFRSMRPVSKMSKRIRRFRLYFVIGWGLPLILSSAFYAVDEIYRDPKSGVVVPDYGIKSCFVAIWSRGYYMYSLVAIALAFNTILVLWTFFIFHEFRKQNAKLFTTKRTKSDKYSVRLFIKLFCVMGVAWFVELLSWLYNGESKPWYVVALDCFMFLQAVAIFFIFCVNRRTLKQLEDKYSCLRSFIGPLRTFKWFTYSDGDGVEMTTPGSTPRKLSLSVTTNTKIDSTLPRKTSTSSTRSGSAGSSTKYIINGKVEKMESISLDSECESGGVTLESQKELKIQQAPDLISNT